MKLALFGSHLCQDTLYALMKLKDSHAVVQFRNISTDFGALKTFMKLREQESIFKPVKDRDGLGIPLFILEDGTKTLDLEEVIKTVGKGETKE